MNDVTNENQQQGTSTARQMASRINGAQSHGPTTEVGKSRSRRNAFKHGARAESLLLDEQVGGELLRKIRAHVQQDYSPRTLLQNFAVDTMIAAIMGFRRCHSFETKLLDAGLVFTDHSCERIMRYMAMCDKRFDRALAYLHQAFDGEDDFDDDDVEEGCSPEAPISNAGSGSTEPQQEPGGRSKPE